MLLEVIGLIVFCYGMYIFIALKVIVQPHALPDSDQGAAPRGKHGRWCYHYSLL